MSIAKINELFKNQFNITIDILPTADKFGTSAFPRFLESNSIQISVPQRRQIALYGLYKSKSNLTANDLKDLFGLFDEDIFSKDFNIDKIYLSTGSTSTTTTMLPNGQVVVVPGTQTYETIDKNISFKTPSKEQVFKSIIKPLMQKWITNNIDDRDVLFMYKKFIDLETNAPKIIEAIDYVGGQLMDEVTFGSAADDDATFDWNDGNVFFDIPIDKFFNDLINATNTLEENKVNIGILSGDVLEASDDRGLLDIMAILGMDAAIDEQFGESAGGGNPEIRSAAQLEQALRDDPSLFAKITGAVQGQDYKAPTAEELISLRQCALITRLLHDNNGRFSNYFRFSDSPLNPKFEGNQRIYPVDPSYDPNIFYNRCHISQAAKQSLVVNSTADVNNPAAMYKALFWVFEADDGKIKEIELALSTNKKEQKEAENYYQLTRALGVFRNTDGTITPGQKLARVKSITGKDYNEAAVVSALAALNNVSSEVEESDQAYYYLNDIEIKYEGTNPSTARKDVQVQLSFSLSSMKALQSVMATIPSIETGTASDVDIKLYDLITLPNTNKISKGPGAYLQNQYSPEYSRVRLKVYTGDGHQCDLIIDLSTIDHTIQRESETGKTTLTINYRGFFEAMMNMPFNDALADTETIDRRKKLHGEAMSIINSNNCKAETISSAMRMEQEIFRREGQSASASSILARLSKLGCIHGYTLKEERIKARAFNGTLDAFEDYVDEVDLRETWGLNAEGEKILATETQKARDGEDGDAEELSRLNNMFFFLGDLLYTVSGCLYENDNSAEMRDVVKNMNMRFMIGSMNVPNPQANDGSLKTINPIAIPIDVAYFVEWFNSTIVKKGVTTYPVGIFIKELIERLVNNIIFEVCFSSLLPSENPPIIRSTFISNFDDQGWFNKNPKGFFNPDDPYNRFGVSTEEETMFGAWLPKAVINSIDRSRLPESLFKKDAQFNLDTFNNKVYETNPYNYCIIYQQFPSFSQYTTRDAKQKMRNSDYVPTIFYGAKNTNFNYVTNVGFSKTTAPFLREARYFNSSYGNLSLLSNVYDISFSFIRRKANTFLYPGIIINFALIDWEGTGTISPYQAVANNSAANGNAAASDDYAILGQNNPHSPKTMAHILGFGGYYIIKSVTYKLGQTEDNFEISINGTFMGTDAIKKGTRKVKETTKITDKKECVEAFKAFETRVYEVGGTISESMVVVNVSTQDTTSAANTERASELPPSETESSYYGTSDEDGFDSSSPIESEVDPEEAAGATSDQGKFNTILDSSNGDVEAIKAAIKTQNIKEALERQDYYVLDGKLYSSSGEEL
jgi:hypothetical protein